jgi:hypothetical protein
MGSRLLSALGLYIRSMAMGQDSFRIDLMKHRNPLCNCDLTKAIIEVSLNRTGSWGKTTQSFNLSYDTFQSSVAGL